MLRNFFRPFKAFQIRKKAQELSKTKETPLKSTKQIKYYSSEMDALKTKILSETRDITMYDLLKNDVDISDIVDMEYKQYSNQPHWDPKSDQYVHSERDEQYHRESVDNYNAIIDEFKRDLEIQRQVIKELENLDRPYLTKGVPGNTKNLFEKIKDYSEPTQTTNLEEFNDMLQVLDNDKSYINNSNYIAKIPLLQHEKELIKLIDERPVNSHFHPDKGSKFDVVPPEEQRFEHVADRLGHPEIFLNPIETLIRSDRIIAHPTFQDQPFVKIPPASPEDSVNFEQGEVIYENPTARDWTKFFNMNVMLGGLTLNYYAAFYWYNSLPDPEFMNYLETIIRQYDIYQYDRQNLLGPIFVAIPILFMVLGQGLISKLTKPFIHSIQYSKNKDLVFVKFTNLIGETKEKVFEIDHIEKCVPYLKTFSHLEDFGDNGITKLTCLNTFENLWVSNNPKFWKEGERDVFLERVSRLMSKEYVNDGAYERYSENAQHSN